MANERQEMLEKSATLYFGPWYRKSPMFEATRRAGCTAYDIYNHMYLPGYYDDPEVEYFALNNVKWPVTADGAEIGKVTSAIYSPRLKKNIGYAWVPTQYASHGTSLGVSSEWGDRNAVVVEMPFVDPKKEIPVS